MKSLIVIFCSTLLALMFSCNKNAGTINKAAITGNWNIVSDSAYTGVGSTNHPVNYAGKPGDYFNITANGIVYTKEGSTLDTLSYHFVGDTAIVISSFGATLNGVAPVSHIATIGSTGLIITSPKFLTPGGVFWRKVTLSK
jgi:phage tail protein X